MIPKEILNKGIGARACRSQLPLWMLVFILHFSVPLRSSRKPRKWRVTLRLSLPIAAMAAMNSRTLF